MKRIVRGFVVIGLLGALLGIGDLSERDQQAVDVTRQWLALVDAERYQDSWTQAASLFKGAVSAGQWAQQARAARGPLGALVSREIQSVHYATSLPGAPDGEYVVIQFRSAFANKASAVETVTPMKDRGEWRVSGYYIR
jgi:hypothetical protein